MLILDNCFSKNVFTLQILDSSISLNLGFCDLLSKMKTIIIAGSGPVGSFMAVLCAHLGFKVIVYEKRQGFTRNINLKIERYFFEKVQEVLSRLNVETEYFSKLNIHLYRQNDKILIKDLEEKFTKEAMSQGAVYITKEVTSFEELYKHHKDSSPIILDCTGRNSKLRINEFGSDKNNIVTTPLQHAMYINCRAKHTENISSLYQVMKYISSIKLSEVVVSKSKNKDDFIDITLPVFITSELAHIFDEEYPDINKEPLNPFNTSTPVPDSIFFPISSLLGNLIVDGCIIDFNSVKVKKIYISCGYAKKRSKDKYVCLGDSAIHLAYFRSLNLGLKHALDFFIKLSMLQNVNIDEQRDAETTRQFKLHQVISVHAQTDFEIMKQFKRHNPHLNPIKVYPTAVRNVFLVVTKVIWYGCFSYNLTNHKTERLTVISGVHEREIINIHRELNEKLCTQRYFLTDFEIKREEDIKQEMCHKQVSVYAQSEAEIMKQFKKYNPHLNPTKVYPTAARNIFLVVTKVIWYGCFSYNLTNHETERLTNHLGVYEREIINIHKELNEKLCIQRHFLTDLGTKRDEDIKREIQHKQVSVHVTVNAGIMKQFKEKNPQLNPIKVYPTVARNVFLVVTKVIWYGCFSYNLTNHETERLTNHLGVGGSQVISILNELNQKLRSWSNLLADFETKRDEDIKREIDNNITKNLLYDYISWFIDINGKSFIKISEIARAASGKHALFKKDFELILRCFKVRKEAIATGYNAITVLNSFLNSNDGKNSSSFTLALIKNELAQSQNVTSISSKYNRFLDNANFQSAAGSSLQKMQYGRFAWGRGGEEMYKYKTNFKNAL